MKPRTIIILASLGLSFIIRAHAAPGDPDPTFGAGGAVVTPVGPYGWGEDVTVQSDGKIVMVGRFGDGSSTKIALVRYNSNGSLDDGGTSDSTPGDSFGTGGIVLTLIGLHTYASAVAVQTDGKIVVAGYAFISGGNEDFALARYNTNGSLDDGGASDTTPGDSFGTGGVVITAFPGGGDDEGYALALQSDGRIVVAGRTIEAGTYKMALARYSGVDGSLDTSFDTDGLVVTAIGAYAEAYDIAIQPDGKIVAAGYGFDGGGNRRFALARYHGSNGSLDASFDSDGVVLTTDIANASITGLALQSDGKILAAGSLGGFSSNFLYLARYDGATGSLDSTFGSGGIAAPGSLAGAADLVLQPDGKALVGYGNKLMRLESNGSPDQSFGNNGVATLQSGTTAINAYALALQADGKVVAAGTLYSPSDGQPDFAVTRLITAATPSPEIAVWQQGVEEVSDGTSVSFGDVTVGSSASMNIEIFNVGALPLTGVSASIDGADAALFSITTSPAATVAPGSSTVCTVQFSPVYVDTINNRFAWLRIASNDGNENPFDVGMIGTGTAPPVPEIAVELPAGTGLTDGISTVTFQVASAGATQTRTFTVRNAGTETLTGLALTKDGPFAADFTLGALGATTLAAGATTTFDVTFTGASPYQRTAALHIASNDADENPFDIALSGSVPIWTEVTGGGGVSIPSIGSGTPYPSTLSVTGIGAPYFLKAKINGLSHTWPDDIDIFLVSPAGSVIALMSDAGGSAGVSAANLVFDDGATQALPDASLIASGTYLPTNYETGESLPPGASGPLVTSLFALAGSPPNGTWKLYVSDDASGDTGSISSWSLLFYTPEFAPPLAIWRQQYFGTVSNSGNAADDADADGDGLENLLEWACNLNPITASTLPAGAVLNGANLEFTYERSVSALNAGTVFSVEWSDTLPGIDPWSSAGVTEQILSDNGTVQQVKATVPAGSGVQRFVRLRITSPP